MLGILLRVAQVSTRIGNAPPFPSATMGVMKIALLGAMGFVGQVAARELAGRADVAELLLVDYNVREANS